MIPDYSRLRRSKLFEAYMYTCRHWHWQKHYASIRDYYRPFVRRGDLVFDIGANFGEQSYALLALGCRVVAVEPLPVCQAALHALRPKSRIEVLPCAVGSHPGEITLHVNERSPGKSSASDEWLAFFEKVPSNRGENWDHPLRCSMTTLDSLVQQYGMPSFLKIDVEGFENAVLDGLTAAPAHTRFEFHAQYLAEAIRCIRKPCFATTARFNYSLGDPTGPLRPEWLDADSFIAHLNSTAFADEAYGDILVRS